MLCRYLQSFTAQCPGCNLWSKQVKGPLDKKSLQVYREIYTEYIHLNTFAKMPTHSLTDIMARLFPTCMRSLTSQMSQTT